MEGFKNNWKGIKILIKSHTIDTFPQDITYDLSDWF